MGSIHIAVKACASGFPWSLSLPPPQHPWYHQDWVELPSITGTFPKATLATFQLRNELKHRCCAGKTPAGEAALEIREEESRQIPLGGKRGYGFLPITVTGSFDILSTLSFSPVMQNSSYYSPSFALAVTMWREISEAGEKPCWEPQLASSRRQKRRHHPTWESGVTPSGESLRCSIHSQLIPSEWLSPKDFFILLPEKKHNNRVNKPSKNPWLRQILKDQVRRGREHKLIWESKMSFTKAF